MGILCCYHDVPLLEFNQTLSQRNGNEIIFVAFKIHILNVPYFNLISNCISVPKQQFSKMVLTKLAFVRQSCLEILICICRHFRTL